MTDYYVDTAVGNDSNAGTSEGSGNAWATIGKAAATVAAGDTVYVKASGTYTEDVSVTTVGTAASPIIWEGYTSTPGDGGRVDHVAATTHCFQGANTMFYMFKNWEWTGATYCWDGQHTVDNIVFYNCLFQSASANGAARMDNTIVWLRCEFLNNTGNGMDADASCKLLFCKAQGNTSVPVLAFDWFVFHGNLIINDGAVTNSCVSGDVVNGVFNTLYHSTTASVSSGFGSSSTSHGVVLGNIFARKDNVGGSGNAISNGASNQATTRNYILNWGHNYNAMFLSSSYPGVQWENTFGTDPLFTDPDNNDFTLQDSSTLIGGGWKAGLLD